MQATVPETDFSPNQGLQKRAISLYIINRFLKYELSFLQLWRREKQNHRPNMRELPSGRGGQAFFAGFRLGKGSLMRTGKHPLYY